MPLLLTKAILEANSNQAIFPLQMPKTDFEYNTELLTCVTRSFMGKRAKFEIEVALELGGYPMYSTHFKDIWNPKSALTVGKFVKERLEKKEENLKNFFTPLTRWPILMYGQSIKRFIIRLPPKSSIFTSDPYFFSHLLDIKAEEKVIYVEEGSGGARAIDSFGVFNDSDEVKIITSESQVPETIFLADELEEGTGVTSPAVLTYLHFNMDSRKIMVSLPDYSNTDMANSLKAFKTLIYEAFKKLGIPNSALSIEKKDDEIIFKCKEFPEATGDYTITLSPHLMKIFNLASPKINMSFVVENIFKLTPPTILEHDIFQDLYPITLLSREFGNSDSYIEGFGFDSAFALVKSVEHVVSGKPVFKQQNYKLPLTFLDKHFEPLNLEYNTEVFLTFRLTKVDIFKKNQ